MKDTILERLMAEAGDATLFHDLRFGVRKLPAHEAVGEVSASEPDRRESLSIREIAERRLKSWPGETGD